LPIKPRGGRILSAVFRSRMTASTFSKRTRVRVKVARGAVGEWIPEVSPLTPRKILLCEGTTDLVGSRARPTCVKRDLSDLWAW